MRKYSEFLTEKFTRHPLLISEFALDIYAVLFLFMLIRRYWILYGITLVILGHIADVLFSWFVHVKEAREIQLFKSWLLWWIRVGLDFATSAPPVFHRVFVANVVNFWNLIGNNFTINLFDKIATEGRTNFLNRAKEQLHELTTNRNNFVTSLRPKRNNG